MTTRPTVAAGCALCFLFGCGSATTKILRLSAADEQRTAEDCERVFPPAPFEATHVVEASIPFSDDTSLIGVVAAQPNNQGFRSLLLSQEGIILFDATRRGETIEVARALPPIDADGFGRHMTDDVRLVLIHPEGQRPEVGHTQQGARICRWTSGEEQVEVVLLSQHEAQLTRLRRGSVVRHAWLKDIRDDGFARDILLETTSVVGYQLHLTLVSFDRKNDSPAPLTK
jgi:hypothetical protein